MIHLAKITYNKSNSGTSRCKTTHMKFYTSLLYTNEVFCSRNFHLTCAMETSKINQVITAAFLTLRSFI